MELIRGIPKTEYLRPAYQKMQGPPPDAEGGPGGPGGPGPEMPPMPADPPAFAALEVRCGKVVSQDPAITGEFSDSCAKNVRLNAHRGDLGGVYVSGEGTDFTLEHASIRLSGEGFGLGGKISGAAVEDHATLTLRDCRINMDGKLRCATSAGDHAVLKVYDSMLVSHGDPWPVDEKEVTWIIGPGMAKPPVFLEIEGNMRTHCTVQNSESYFYDSTIIADSWAALSTDAGGDRVYLEANDCKVITTRSGYGTYADTDCHCVLNRCDLDVENMAAIVAGESSVRMVDCTAKCGSYVIMNHVVGGGPGEGIFTQVSKVDIVGGKYRCGDDAIVLKSCNSDLLVDGAEITAHTGVLVRTKLNDDPCAPDPKGREVYGVHVTLKNLSTDHDIIHGDPNRRMTLTLENTTLTGAITGGVMLSLGSGSHWVASKDSDVTLWGDLAPDAVDALPGVTVTAKGASEGTYSLPSGGVLKVIV